MKQYNDVPFGSNSPTALMEASGIRYLHACVMEKVFLFLF